ncbi:hypothetical protein N7478_009396 [Penicillium angulare]|uniref:uncharacterized protein n=1 Tax=Penicillium angulare TaxID=116970 RepID=UPI00253F905B|nr:uncharacterized protein N7478_009396 [Penicillium angulare]KAJ5266588.1 hypothetical protein N7478_009396 [Penicillium angulare]
MAALPVITCGGVDPQVLNVVKPLYLPEYEGKRKFPNLVHSVTSAASGAIELPYLLQGKALPTSEDPNASTGENPKLPVSIFIGALYGDKEVEEMRQACQGISSVPWLKMDLAVPRPPLGPGYAEHVVKRVKACMKRIEAEGKLEEDGLWLF